MKLDDAMVQVVRFLAEMGYGGKTMQPETKLCHDLGIAGLDAAEVMKRFAERFKLQTDDFHLERSFPPECDSFLLDMLHHLGLVKRRMIRDLTVQDLANAIVLGRIDN